MARVLHFSSGPESWKALLADPDKHWKTGYSARTLAHCWEEADGFPAEVAKGFAASNDELLRGLEPVLAVPEFKVPLNGGRRPSQNDIFVLAKSTAGPVAIMVEGKVKESFGPTIEEWRAEASPGKEERMAFLLEKLGVSHGFDGDTRYQLLHRAASALITAEQFRAVAAVLLVHSFSEQRMGWPDYQAFLSQLGVTAEPEVAQRVQTKSAVPLFTMWVAGNCAYLAR